MTETWRSLPGWVGIYEVSDEGSVRSLDRVVETARGSRFYVGQALNPTPDSDGYLLVQLSRPRRLVGVHRLVMLAFRGPCPPGLEVCHGDGVPSNNRLSNLRYGTRSSNSLDSVAHGTNPLVKFQTSKTSCPLLHLLAAPNLVPNFEGRKCLACSRARGQRASLKRRGKLVPDLRELADQYYAALGMTHQTTE